LILFKITVPQQTALGTYTVPLIVSCIQPPLFKITVPQQTALGTYTVPLIVKIREPSVATITKPISANLRGGMVDPLYVQLSKKYTTVGSITLPVNFTVTVIPP
jgi:hypothetical protein